MTRSYKQGIYEVTNMSKYIGTKSPRYLSSYELEVFQWADRSPTVLKWGAEVVVVEYFNPVKNRKARYIVDLFMEYVTKTGEVKKALIEIKPSSQTTPPKKGRKSENTYIQESLTWMTNSAKWDAAAKYANDRGWDFRILTEKSIFR